MKDEIVIAQALNKQVRIHAARTTEMVRRARELHDCYPTSIAALGRVMSVTAIMASDLKNPYESVTSIINGHGPAGTILAQAQGNGDVRGFIGDPHLYFSREDGHLDVSKAVGTSGSLTVVRDTGLKEPFTGVTDLQTGEIGDDFTYYFAISEQIPSVVGVGVLCDQEGVKAAGGLIYQLMPNASEEAIAFCENVAATQKPVSTLIDEGLDLEEMIKMYFPDAEILDHKDIRWHCDCSKEKFLTSLSTLSEEDLQEMIDDNKGAEITCQYCSSTYTFTTEELQGALNRKHGI